MMATSSGSSSSSLVDLAARCLARHPQHLPPLDHAQTSTPPPSSPSSSSSCSHGPHSPPRSSSPGSIMSRARSARTTSVNLPSELISILIRERTREVMRPVLEALLDVMLKRTLHKFEHDDFEADTGEPDPDFSGFDVFLLPLPRNSCNEVVAYVKYLTLLVQLNGELGKDVDLLRARAHKDVPNLTHRFFRQFVGYVFWILGDLRQAEKCFMRSVDDTTNKVQKITLLNEVARMHQLHGNVDDAVKFHELACDEHEVEEDKRCQWMLCGAALDECGQPQRALEYFNRALSAGQMEVGHTFQYFMHLFRHGHLEAALSLIETFSANNSVRDKRMEVIKLFTLGMLGRHAEFDRLRSTLITDENSFFEFYKDKEGKKCEVLKTRWILRLTPRSVNGLVVMRYNAWPAFPFFQPPQLMDSNELYFNCNFRVRTSDGRQSTEPRFDVLATDTLTFDTFDWKYGAEILQIYPQQRKHARLRSDEWHRTKVFAVVNKLFIVASPVAIPNVGCAVKVLDLDSLIDRDEAASHWRNSLLERYARKREEVIKERAKTISETMAKRGAVKKHVVPSRLKPAEASEVEAALTLNPHHMILRLVGFAVFAENRMVLHCVHGVDFNQAFGRSKDKLDDECIRILKELFQSGPDIDRHEQTVMFVMELDENNAADPSLKLLKRVFSSETWNELTQSALTASLDTDEGSWVFTPYAATAHHFAGLAVLYHHPTRPIVFASAQGAGEEAAKLVKIEFLGDRQHLVSQSDHLTVDLVAVDQRFQWPNDQELDLESQRMKIVEVVLLDDDHLLVATGPSCTSRYPRFRFARFCFVLDNELNVVWSMQGKPNLDLDCQFVAGAGKKQWGSPHGRFVVSMGCEMLVMQLHTNLDQDTKLDGAPTECQHKQLTSKVTVLARLEHPSRLSVWSILPIRDSFLLASLECEVSFAIGNAWSSVVRLTYSGQVMSCFPFIVGFESWNDRFVYSVDADENAVFLHDYDHNVFCFQLSTET